MRSYALTMGARVRELDGVRGVAILIVVVAHASGPGPTGGGVGVTLFFVISGYLITGVLLREIRDEGGVDLRAFWARRARRLVPAAIPLVLLILTAGLVTNNLSQAAEVVGSIPVADYVHAARPHVTVLSHTWSLAVEEQFYLLWPLALGAMVARGGVQRWLLAGVAMFGAWRLLLVLAGESEWAYFSLDGNAYALFAGAAGATMRRRSFPAGVVWTALVALLAVSALPLSPAAHVAVGPAIAAASLVLVLGCQSVPALAWRPLVFAGSVSYGWYLWHYPAIAVAGHTSGVVPRSVAVVVALGLAAASWRWLERPVLRQGRADAPEREMPAATAEAPPPASR